MALVLLTAGGASALAEEGLHVRALDVGASAGFPVGKYREISLFAGGVESRVLIKFADQVPIYAITNVQVLGNVPAVAGTSVVDSAGSIGAGMLFPLSGDLSLAFGASYGIMLHQYTREVKFGLPD